ncbi:multiple sugar transport system substrate-binding protein [Streptomyces sp. SAI-208]|jgi:multiple sugar transport system substrate-binding protein|uniref:ABC transporter substrate-binding protein n=1 Tax=unclassified Streptomyces TaxID=2593676 RepID=UPI00247651AD|nr:MULTISPECIES: sugar ABC transporter substrate-binding protein [unclassified Streptomyces]MDH6565396.1 multiple sugar transport system substrate-binding protein [Streptomyces sp. SAI-117]MDH6589687.1 multiple sugar transport system substrate-binding protein [Streptomyces sp. SAI-133]MDH6604960.1 multiple sugar transport system substrate-binding protein [Streptomyces sp. SAI-208]
MRTSKFRRIVAAAAATVATALFASACSDAGTSTSSGGKVTLQYWAWAPGSAQEVKEFNRTHPDIKVVHTDAGGGEQSSAKLLAAIRAGNAPDLALVENTSLPRMIVAGAPLDITDYVSDVRKNYSAGSWAQTTFGGQTYGLPQDVGPMALLYRKDVFDKYGIKAPVTWEDYRKAAARIKARNPKLTMASLSTDGWGWYAAVAAQAGDDWWSVDGDKWTVNIDGANSRKVMDFFQGMFKDGLITADPILTPTYNQQLNNGTMLSWPSAAWAPGVIYGVAPKTAGKWALAPLPRWNADDPTVSFQGGSSVIVTSKSKHPKEAAEFAKWLNAGDQGAKMILNVQNGYPAALSGQKAATAQKPPALMPQQSDYYSVVAEIAKHTRPVTWGPNTDVAATAFTDAMNAAVHNGTSWADVLTVTQKAVVKDLKKQGFKVSEG